jgi:hypothetical protein
MAGPQGWWSAAVFYPIGCPTPYAYIFISVAAATFKKKQKKCKKKHFLGSHRHHISPLEFKSKSGDIWRTFRNNLKLIEGLRK